ncbi:MAG: hypothetical protein R3244_05570, partial [Thermoanaerobaculia bacterium]|nr:hypothetical protein [Thermoanaerobaculia bacterium]
GVVSGMSGSPVYIDGRLIGAVAFAWPFTRGAVGGITPIDSMLELAAAGETSASTGLSRLPTLPTELLAAELEPSLLADELERLVPALPSEGRDGVVWSLSGFGARTRGMIERALTGVAPSGAAGDAVDSELRPGSAVAGVLIDGDLKVAATGTVTERRGEEILAFGHSFLGRGRVRVPMAAAEVVTVLSSRFVSFKIANVGPVVGSFELDRSSGVRGRVGVMVETVPLEVRIGGMAERTFHMELANEPALLPMLVAISSLGALDAATQAAGDQGIDLVARWDLAGYEPLEIRQSFDGGGAGIQSAIYLLLLTNFLANNPLEETRLESVAVSLEQYPQPRTTRLVSASADRSIVEPGAPVVLTLGLMPFRGEPTERRLALDLPRDLPDGRYSLVVGDGVTIDRIRQVVEPVVPETFDQALDMVRRFHSERDLVVLGLVPSWGLSFAGHALPQLPGSIRRLWQDAPPGAAVPLAFAIAEDRIEPSEVPLAGAVRVDLEVRQTPAVSMQPEEDEGDGGDGQQWVRRGGEPGKEAAADVAVSTAAGRTAPAGGSPPEDDPQEGDRVGGDPDDDEPEREGDEEST